jgi:hypothetical protein
MRKKNNDYCGGGDSSPFKNFNGSAYLGIDPVKGILMRIMDKMQRVTTYCDNGRLAVVEESVDDALEDIINYCILAKGMIHERREKPIGRTEADVGEDITMKPFPFIGITHQSVDEDDKPRPASMGPLAPRVIKTLNEQY